MNRLSPALRARAAGVLAVSAVALSLIPAAQAAEPRATGSCDARVAEQPFLRWLDPASYVLVPNGSVERSGGWDLRGGAARVAGNESFHVHGKLDAWSLAIPPRSSATTAPMCVGLDHPTLRLFVINRGSLLSPLRVDVLFKDVTGVRRAVRIGAYLGTSGWQPTVPLAVLANISPPPGEHIDVAFRFTSLGDGDWSIDDVYVDPFRHG